MKAVPPDVRQLRFDKCIMCAEHLEIGRADKRFCSAKCRVRYHRWLKRFDWTAKQAETFIEKMGEYLAYEQTVLIASPRLVELQQKIDALLSYHRVVKVKVGK